MIKCLSPRKCGTPSATKGEYEPLLQSLRVEIVKAAADQREARQLYEAQNQVLEKQLEALLQRVDSSVDHVHHHTSYAVLETPTDSLETAKMHDSARTVKEDIMVKKDMIKEDIVKEDMEESAVMPLRVTAKPQFALHKQHTERCLSPNLSPRRSAIREAEIHEAIYGPYPGPYSSEGEDSIAPSFAQLQAIQQVILNKQGSHSSISQHESKSSCRSPSRSRPPIASWIRRFDFSRRSNRAASMAEMLRKNSERPGSSRFRRVFRRLAYSMEWFAKLQEPARDSCLASFVMSKPVEVITAVIIGLNALFVGYTTNYEMSHLDERPTDFILAVELFFVTFYTIELLLKLLVHRGYLFFNKDGQWNIFDSVVLLVTYFDLLNTFLLWGSGAENTNLTYMRMLRIFKIVKVVRTLRALRFFTELRLMLDCVLGSFIQLFWCLAMIVFVVYMFSLIFVQGMVDYLLEVKLEGKNVESQTRTQIADSFGSVQNGVVTLFQSVTGGVDWSLEYDLVILSGWVRGAVFLFFIVFFVIAIWNIIMSTFVEQVLNLAKPDIDTLMYEKRRRDDNDAMELRELFDRMHIDSQGRITAEEFERCIGNEAFASFLQARGVDIKEARTFFTMLSESSELDNGVVDVGTIVGSCLRIKGFATSVDLHILRYEIRMAQRKQLRMLEKFQAALGSVTRLESVICGKTLSSRSTTRRVSQ